MKNKEAILIGATSLFSQKGFKDTHIGEISKTIGVAEGTIFYHFKNKEGLFVAILSAFKNNIIAELDQYQRQAHFVNGLEKVEALISFYLQMAEATDDRFLLLHRHDAYELAQTRKECRQLLEDIYNCLIDVFEKAIEQGQQDGSIRKLPSRKLAMIIFAMVDALLRFNTYGLYNAGTLFGELISACRNMLQNR